MLTPEELLSRVNTAIAGLEYPSQPVGLYEPIEYVLSLGGKRIRPVFMLLSAQACGGDLSQIMPAAVGLETYHNFTLLHDDLMDRAEMRRGKPTVHIKWDANTAILSGDTMLVLAAKYIKSAQIAGVNEAMDMFIKTALEVHDGQQYDMNFETRLDVSEAEYLEMIRLKTSVLIACATGMGAILSGADKATVEGLYKFGEQIGLAFQLQDDLLDVYGDPKVFGKNIGGDILCNKKTYLLINALQRANAQQRAELEHWIALTDYEPQDKIAAVTNIYNSLGIKHITINSIERYYASAKSIIESINLPQEQIQPLWDFAAAMMNRNY